MNDFINAVPLRQQQLLADQRDDLVDDVAIDVLARQASDGTSGQALRAYALALLAREPDRDALVQASLVRWRILTCSRRCWRRWHVP